MGEETQRNTLSFGHYNLGFQLGQNFGGINVKFDSNSDQYEQSQNNKCLSALSGTDPRYDKSRIERLKGGLLEDAYCWVFENPDFQRWLYGQESRLLWVRGDPGKGKTMLLCGIIDDLIKSQIESESEATIIYFFCQAGDDRLNHATGVVRGLIFMLVKQHPSLIIYVRHEYDNRERVFEDRNTWEVLLRIWKAMIQDPILQTTYVIIDALDECTADLDHLLEFMIQNLSSNAHGRWLVSSRNEEWVVNHLEIQRQNASLSLELLSLELNSEFVSLAVETFIDHRLQKLSKAKSLSPETLSSVSEHVRSNADGTFLWVALVCEELSNPQLPSRHVLSKLHQLPAGLNKLYQLMLDQIINPNYHDSELCKSILAIITTVYRPITLEELSSYIDLNGDTTISDLPEIVRRCGSFIVLRGSMIFLVHQSAKEFLVRQAVQDIFPHGPAKTHYRIFSRSLQSMTRLRRDIYGLVHPGYDLEKVQEPCPDPLATVRYSCVHWMDHLEACSQLICANFPEDLRDGGSIDLFLRKEYLHWIEAISLLKNVSKGIGSMLKLQALIESENQDAGLVERVKDAVRFFLYHQTAIRSWPLQVYASALVFSPVDSITRLQYGSQQPAWVTQKPDMEYQWSPCLQTLEAHRASVSSVYFFNDSKFLTSGSADGTVRLWNTSNGECLTTQEKNAPVSSIAPFQEPKFAILTPIHRHRWRNNKYRESTIEVCDTTSNSCCTAKMNGGDTGMCCLAVWDSRFVVIGSMSGMIKIWDTQNRERIQTLEGHRDTVAEVSISPQLNLLASASYDNDIRIWDLHSRECVQILTEHRSSVKSVAFSPNSLLLASGSIDHSIRLWSTRDWHCIYVLGRSVSRPPNAIWRALTRSLAFSHDSNVLAVGSELGDIHLWDTSNGRLLQTFKGHRDSISSVAFSHDSKLLASGSDDFTIRIWDATSRQNLRDFNVHHAEAIPYFSHDSTLIATTDDDCPYDVKIWDAQDGKCLQSINDWDGGKIKNLIFSRDLKYLVSDSADNNIRFWDISAGQCMRIFKYDFFQYPSYTNDMAQIFADYPDFQYRLGSGTVVQPSYFAKGPSFAEHKAYIRAAGLGMSVDGARITWNYECLLWLPLEYRPKHAENTVLLGSKLYISCASGRVLLFNFDVTEISRLAGREQILQHLPPWGWLEHLS